MHEAANYKKNQVEKNKKHAYSTHSVKT